MGPFSSLVHTIGETFGSAPIAQRDHFTFGVLHLMQELALVLNPGKFDDTVVNLALRVAALSTESYLQLKAFKLLVTICRKPGVGTLPDQMIEAFLENDEWPEDLIQRAEKQWEAMRVVAAKKDSYRRNLKRAQAKYPKMRMSYGSKVIRSNSLIYFRCLWFVVKVMGFSNRWKAS